MTISFPKNSIAIVADNNVIQNAEQKVLLVAQKSAAGSAVANSIVKSIGNQGEEDALFGPRSQAAHAVREFKKINPLSRIDVLVLEDAGSATAATGSVQFAGTATDGGRLEISVVSSKNFKARVDIVKDDTAADVAAKLQAAHAAFTQFPCTPVQSTDTVNYTAVNKGSIGNGYTIQIEGSVPGITATITGFSGGATDPNISTIYDNIGSVRYNRIVQPFEYGLDELETLLESRFNINYAIEDGIGVTCAVDSISNLKTLGNSKNSKVLQIIGDKTVNNDITKGAGIVEASLVKAVTAAAISSLRLTDGANIGSLVVAKGAGLDAFGGPALAGLPYANTPLYNLDLPLVGNDISFKRVLELQDAGISVYGPNKANNQLIMGEAVTTYKTDAAGNEDVTFKFVNYIDTETQAREFFWNQMNSTYGQSRLTEGDLIAGRAINNQESIEADLVSWFGLLGGPEYVLCQSGAQAIATFRQGLIVLIDMGQGKVTITMDVPIVTQLRELVTTMVISFNLNEQTQA